MNLKKERQFASPAISPFRRSGGTKKVVPPVSICGMDTRFKAVYTFHAVFSSPFAALPAVFLPGNPGEKV